jgi:hypothetical protein
MIPPLWLGGRERSRLLFIPRPCIAL